eukprot:TRINITY_DN2050_c0_g1_i2.p1 TRINITY_DN2050_c0_g1~~TRINITY_DN2050_c0_g1_i2.p1  ORF type:complete len:259 (-),score=63.27 TRINITY_DN2050_c0_g1_i2:45-779(-)
MDKSLDELVEKEKKSFRGRGSNKAGTGGQGNKGKQGGQPRTENTNRGGPVRRGGRNGGRKQSPYSRPGSADASERWGHDLFKDDGPAPQRVNKDSSRYGTKVSVTNLRFDVLEESLEELFSTCGTVHSVKVFYDKSGRSEGKGEVVFKSNGEAERAVREYNGVSIEGQPMTVEVAGQVVLRNKQEPRVKSAAKGGMRSDSTEFDNANNNNKNTRTRKQNQEAKSSGGMEIEDSDLTNLKIRVSF